MIFSNNQIWWIAQYYRASDTVGRKKGKFCGIFRDRFAEIFMANVAEKQSVKSGWFRGNFVGNFH